MGPKSLSHLTLERGQGGGMMTWRKRLFVALAHNAATSAVYFRLPIERTVVMGSRLRV